MNVGSLFSGIGGLDLGLARAGFIHSFLCESDEWRRGVLSARFPGVPIFSDVREVDAASWPARDGPGRRALGGEGRAPAADGALGNGSRPDLLCGGFPCQDVSIAGKRAGLAGDRSSLFHEFARVAEFVRPRWLLIENVPGLLSSNGGRDFGVVLGALAALGYGVGWRTLDSRYFGVPQRRRRVFVLGTHADGDPRAAAERSGEILAVGSRCARHPATSSEAGEDVALPLGGRTDNGRGGGTKYDLDHDTYVVNAGIAENQRAEVLETPYLRQLTAGGGKPGQGYPTVRAGDLVRRLTPRECERLQDLPDDWTAPGPDSRRYAALGDAVTASVGEWIGRRLMERDDEAR